MVEPMLGNYTRCNEHRYCIGIWTARVPVVATFSTKFQLIKGYVDMNEKASEEGIEIFPYKRFNGKKQVLTGILRGVENGSLVKLVQQVRERKIMVVPEERVLLI